MQLRIFGKVLGFLTLLINSLGPLADVVEPILHLINLFKGRVAAEKGPKLSTKTLIAHAPKAIQSKLTAALPKAIQNLGLGVDASLTGDALINGLVTTVAKLPDHQRSWIYSKMASNLYREIDPKTSEAEADTVVQLAYLKSKLNGSNGVPSSQALAALSSEDPEAETADDTNQQ